LTTISLYTDPGVLLTLGGQWRLVVETRDSSGYLSGSVTPSLLVTLPDGSMTTPAFTAWSWAGAWSATYTPLVTGRFVAHVSTPEDATEAAAYVLGATTSSGMPNVSDVARYLRTGAASWTVADLQDELDSEADAQRAVCGVRAVYPRDLRKALLRRVQRALALRALPLAVVQGESEGGITILPGRDPEVRRLEGPYRKLGCG
jgi:hypothetical protein